MSKRIQPTKKQIRDLYKENFGRGDNLIYNRIKDKTERLGGIDISKWDADLSKKYRFTTREKSAYRKSFTELYEGRPISEIREEKHRFSLKITDAKDLYDRTKKYVDTINNLIAIKDDIILKNHRPLYGKRWYAYFLYHPSTPNNIFDKEPILGRAVVFIKMCKMSDTESNLSSTNPIHNRIYEVHTYNAGVDNPMNYYGFYEIPVSTEKNIIIFDFYSKYNARRLHIKMFYDIQTQNENISKYLLGMYNAYEGGSILSGNILFEEIPDDIKDEDLKQDSFSIIHNPDHYAQISEEVKSFFSLAQSNLLVLPERLKQTVGLSDLEKMVSVDQDKFSLFLEQSSPRVYVSIPNSLSTKNREGATKIVEKLQDDFSKVNRSHGGPLLDIQVNSFQSEETTHEKPYAFEDLKSIRTTRFFILIIDDISTVDYELIKFSWALAYAKVVILISKSGVVTDSVLQLNEHRDLREHLFIPYHFDNELDEKTCDKLYSKVYLTILRYLPESLDERT